MQVAIGSDHRGVAARHAAREHLRRLGHDVREFGSAEEQAVDYPDVAAAVGRAVADGAADRGILFCGTGIGVSIAANKIAGVRAAVCHDRLTAEMSRRHNDANVLCLSAEQLGAAEIQTLITLWLETPFEGGRHQRRVDKIRHLEQGGSPRCG